MKGLYIHIPFCEHICHYCDFVKQVPKNDEMIDKYLDALLLEIESYRSHFNTIKTIYIGGGTPSMLKPYQMERLLKALQEINPIEFTIEVNPESYTMTKGLIWKQYGINRVSIGVQSFNNDILKFINRMHNKDMVIYAVNNLKQIGINNISVDLIYAIPGQTKEILMEDLNVINQLNIDHISCYSLILEDKTYFYHQYLKGNYEPVDNEIEGMMFEIVMDTLKDYGFDHYEISNFSKNNKESLHNKLYWNLDEYIGVGLGAHGFIDGKRTYNNKSINKYMAKPQVLTVDQTNKDNIADYFIFGLRLIKGINIKYAEDRFNFNLLESFPELQEKIDAKLVVIEGGMLKLTPKGVYFGNQVFEVFV